MTREANAKSARRWIRVFVGACFLILIALAIRYKLPALVRELLTELLTSVQRLGPWAPVIFIFIHICSCVLCLPASVLTMGAGVVFGVVRGSLYTGVAATVAATISFLIARHLARDRIARRIESNPTFAAIDKAVAAEGWKIVGLTRLAPVFPFALLNYGYGITRVTLRDYFFATLLGMIPGTVMYVYLGALIGDFAQLEKGVRSPPLVQWIVGVLIIVTVFYFIRVGRRALAQKIAGQRDS